MSSAPPVDLMLAQQLANYVHAWRPAGWSWANAHCGAFAAGWVQQATGRDALAGLRELRTRREWRDAVAGDLPALVARQLEAPTRRGVQAVAGDVVMLPSALTGGALGVCTGRHAVVLNARAHCVFVPMVCASHSWALAEVGAGVAA